MKFSRRRSLSLIPALAGLATTASAQPAQQDDDDDPPMPLKMVILDIGGTIIGDHGEVPDSMLGAFSRHGITVTPQEFSEWRGASKRGMAKHFVELRGPGNASATLADAIYADFTATLFCTEDRGRVCAGVRQ